MPASDLAAAGMSRHLRPRDGAGESFVSFIRLLGGIAPHALPAPQIYEPYPKHEEEDRRAYEGENECQACA